MRHQRANGNREVERNRDIDRALHAEERKQQHDAGKASRAGAERIDVIEEPDRAPHMTGAADEMAHQHRQRRAHQQGRHDHQGEIDGGHRRQRPGRGERADAIENGERNKAERAGEQFDHRQQRQQRDAALLR
jgi:hypothetical protein